MIQEELKNYIEQNCSGKEPSDLIMEVIGRKIEQFGADADEVLAFVEECAKGPTLEQKAEEAHRTDEHIALLKYYLKRYINIMDLDGCKIRARETRLPWDKYELRPEFFYLYREQRDGFAVVKYEIDDIKAEIVKYSKYDEEIDTLLDEAINNSKFKFAFCVGKPIGTIIGSFNVFSKINDDPVQPIKDTQRFYDIYHDGESCYFLNTWAQGGNTYPSDKFSEKEKEFVKSFKK